MSKHGYTGNDHQGQEQAAEQHNAGTHAHDAAGKKGQTDHLTAHELSVQEHDRTREQKHEAERAHHAEKHGV
jgi:hypothetical protein